MTIRKNARSVPACAGAPSGTANRLLARELEVLRLEAQLQEKTQQSIDKGQRDYYLREQLKVIRGELGENDEDAEINEYREKIEKLHLPQEADEKLHKELQRLESSRMAPPRPASSAITSTSLSNCRGIPARASARTSASPAASSMRTISALRR